jgi:hypothetical protein
VKSDIVGTPLPPNRFEPRPRVLLAQAAVVVPRAMQEEGEGDQPEWRWVLAAVSMVRRSALEH